MNSDTHKYIALIAFAIIYPIFMNYRGLRIKTIRYWTEWCTAYLVAVILIGWLVK